MTLFKEGVEDEDRDKWIVWFDGASSALGHGVRVVLVTPDDQCIPFTTRLDFDCTNNMAEYEAYALGIQGQLTSRSSCSKKLIGYFDDISSHHIPRQENRMVDALATLASMFQLTPHRDLPYIEFRCRGKPAHCYLIEEEQDGKPWYFDIKRYIEDKEYPREASNNDKRTL
ncbi:uncharacterized protein LOC114396968 [Glycine soja]|uniref:uncharacterized protein LOC114396968 n=1 Tax=Glycine soja TaxID=3848 RepID=UPI00103D3AD9|nr:uncharacterized protein LOC114396968 [Glycine soja]